MLWRTTGPWGLGLGRDLNADEIDGNFFEIQQGIDAITAIGGLNSIDDFTVVGDQMTVHMTDHTTRGPFTIPTSAWNGTGAWQPLHVYSLLDTFSINGAMYEVVFPHTSAASFDAGANNGIGDDYYHLIFSAPSNALPTGGTARMALVKVSGTDYDTAWDLLTTEDLEDVVVDTPLIEGDLLTWDDGLNKWINRALSIPLPSSSSRGGVESLDEVSGFFVTGLGDDGVLTTEEVTFDGIPGMLPPDKDLAKLTQTIANSGGVLTIDLDLGYTVVANITANVTSVVITHWPAVLVHAEIVIYFANSGAFTVTGWPSGTIWPGGTDFVITSGAGKWDKVEVCSVDEGTTIWARVCGANYLP